MALYRRLPKTLAVLALVLQASILIVNAEEQTVFQAANAYLNDSSFVVSVDDLFDDVASAETSSLCVSCIIIGQPQTGRFRSVQLSVQLFRARFFRPIQKSIKPKKRRITL